MKKPKKKLRNPAAVPAKTRKAGPMKPRAGKRKKNKDKYFDEEY